MNKNSFLEKEKNKLKNNFFNKIINSNVVFGFLIYLMSDCILFSVFFSVYFIISYNYNCKIFYDNTVNIYYVFAETIILLLSSFFYSVAMVFLKYKKNIYFYFLIFCTFSFGLCFIFMEIHELINLSKINFFLSRNGFFSSFFSLLILHAFHILFGLFWIVFMLFRFKFRYFEKNLYTQFFCLGLFWHFLDIVWMFIFNFVYLYGFIK
ncbi:cytochrome c oxidase subunit 3 [Buchnera aphidicola]|uniref:cytochrome c oxidase subunit 3 n=1 Tax=Buchnera aphidicola TaxID=9 RepID=UPI0031B86F84